MKKEKWLLKEIERWQADEIVSEETANQLKAMYQPKKSIAFLMVLFSIVGSLLIGMGIVMVSANNWWYALPIAVRTFIGFLPLVISQALVLFVYRRKMHSAAFRESAALLNMAGVFASIAIVGQIFHLPGDFTNYLLVCGILFLPTMLVLNAISPLIIYYWTTINGGLCFSAVSGVLISLVLFAIGVSFALRQSEEKSGKSIYLAIITAVSAFAFLCTTSVMYGWEMVIVLYGYALLMLSVSPLLKGGEEVFQTAGRICFLVLTCVMTYRGLWSYQAEFAGTIFIVIPLLLILFATLLFVKNILAKQYCLFSLATLVMLILRGIWCVVGLEQSPFDVIFMIVANGILFVLSIWCIVSGVRKIDLYHANLGMVTLCTLIVMRFFDSELPLAARGIVFLVLGAGFLLFNLYLVRTKKRIKEENL